MTGFALAMICIAALLIVAFWRVIVSSALLCIAIAITMLGSILIFMFFIIGIVLATLLRLADQIILSRGRRE